MRAVAIVLTIASCSYHPKAATGTDDGPRADDAPPSDGFGGSIDVAHLGIAEETKLTGTGTWTVDSLTRIDTSLGTVDPPVPEGIVVLGEAVQETGPAVMVIQAATIDLQTKLEVTGSRPLILVATTAFTLDDTSIDVSAANDLPGPGGFAGSSGPGAGSVGLRVGTADGGGGGASYGNAFPGAAGGVGGNAGATGGAAGAVYGGPNVLQGGSGGAKGASADSACDSFGGPGGGALQITAPVITGLGNNALINAGGGGASGGILCGTDGPSGGGGGSGGMIFLDAPMLAGSIRLFALGGGGGEGGSADGGDNGNDGSDAGISAGAGGFNGTGGGNGGRGGGISTTEPGHAPEDASGASNGGGGGGGTGRVYYRHASSIPYTSTPPADPG